MVLATREEAIKAMKKAKRIYLYNQYTGYLTRVIKQEIIYSYENSKEQYDPSFHSVEGFGGSTDVYIG